MRKVFKYNLALFGMNTVLLPEGYKILNTKAQRETVVLYVEVDVDVTKSVEVDFLTIGTGQFLPSVELDYIDTAIFYHGDLVIHTYRVVK